MAEVSEQPTAAPVTEQPTAAQTTEQPKTNEVKQETRVEGKVRGAIHTAWEKVKATNREYWEIRQMMKDRLAWHGGGVYKFYVENMDKVTKVMWESKNQNFFQKVAEVTEKVGTRLKGAWLAGTSAVADIVRDTAFFWLPIPRDVYKRSVLFRTAVDVARRGVKDSLLVGGMGLFKGVRAAEDFVITAPEASARLGAKGINRIVEQVRKPKPSVPTPTKA